VNELLRLGVDFIGALKNAMLENKGKFQGQGVLDLAQR